MELEGHETTHILVFVDEAGFNLSKGRRRGRNLIGHRATTDTPGQRGTSITMCAAISENGVSTHLPHIGPYNTQLLLVFLNTLYGDLIPEQERGLLRPHLPNYVVIWDNISFHRTNIVRDWFAAHERITVEFLPPYSIPKSNRRVFSEWRWKDHKIRCLCWMPWMLHVRTSQLIIAGDGCVIQGDFSPVHGNGKHQMWCWGKSLAWPTRTTGSPPRIIFMDIILYFCVFVVT